MRRDEHRPRWQLLYEIALYQISVLPFIVGGVLRTMNNTDGMFWIASGMIAAVVVSMLTTWVLLGEILR